MTTPWGPQFFFFLINISGRPHKAATFFLVSKRLDELDTVTPSGQGKLPHFLSELTDRPLTRSFTLAMEIETVTFWDTSIFLTSCAKACWQAVTYCVNDFLDKRRVSLAFFINNNKFFHCTFHKN